MLWCTCFSDLHTCLLPALHWLDSIQMLPSTLQVLCLKAIRGIEAGEKPNPKFENYQPVEGETRALLSRDPADLKQPYLTACQDSLIISMKSISAGMQNTG